MQLKWEADKDNCFVVNVIAHFFLKVKLLRILLSNVIEKAHNRFSDNIAPDEWSLLRHALHDKCASLSFACGDQRSCVGSSPRTTRGDYTASQIFLF